MDFDRPLSVVTPTLDGDVLAALARADMEFTGRQLARQVGRGSTAGVRRAADRLVAQGIVSRTAAGTSHLYRLNQRHIAAAWIEGLASLREQLIDRLRGSVAGWEQPARAAVLFGSVARGRATAGSDLDVLVIRRSGCDPDAETWRSQLLDLQRSATAWTGNDTRVIEYGEDELAAGSTEPLLEEALSDGIELHGSRRELRRLMRGRTS